MTPEEIRAALKEIARSELGDAAARLDGDLAEQLDSVQRLTLLVAVEDRFRICIDPTAEEELRTADDLVRAVAERLERAGMRHDAPEG